MITVALIADPNDVSPTLLSEAAAVLQTQVLQDLAPAKPLGWGVTAAVIAVSGATANPPNCIPLWITSAISNPYVVGYHIVTGVGPSAVVQIESQMENWLYYASHELLELLVDPHGDTRYPGPSIDPDPSRRGSPVSYLVEICDPVQDPAFGYLVNGHLVSNFVLPAYYQPASGLPYTAKHADSGAPILGAPWTLAPGGSICWADPSMGSWMLMNYGDAAATIGAAIGQPPPGISDAEFARMPAREYVHRTLGRHLNVSLPEERIAQLRKDRALAASLRERQFEYLRRWSEIPQTPDVLTP